MQVSKDPTFTTGPDKATAMVYGELRYGGATDTRDSYTLPADFPLEAGTTYSWRVRPRVQGDGTPTDWTAPATVTTPTANAVSLDVAGPANESTVSTATVQVTGKTRPGAIVTVNDDLAIVDAAGNASITVTLTEGITTLDIIAADSAGATASTPLTVSYIP